MAQVVPSYRVSKFSPEISFGVSKESPQGYAEMILRHIGITNLENLSKVFLGDSGAELEVRERRFRRGVQFRGTAAPLDPFARVGWVLFERLLGVDGAQVKARAYRTFEGAAAEFSVRLKLHELGEVSIGRLSHWGGGMRLSFACASQIMVLSPFELAAQEVSFLR